LALVMPFKLFLITALSFVLDVAWFTVVG